MKLPFANNNMIISMTTILHAQQKHWNAHKIFLNSKENSIKVSMKLVQKTLQFHNLTQICHSIYNEPKTQPVIKQDNGL